MKPTYRKRFKQFGGTEDLAEWRAKFVATADPTEYSAALELLGSWAEWERMKRVWPFFTENILPVWLDEQEVFMRSIAISSIAKSRDTKDQKWIAEKRWAPKKMGGPSKAERNRKAKINDELDSNAQDDIARVREAGINEVG